MGDTEKPSHLKQTNVFKIQHAQPFAPKANI